MSVQYNVDDWQKWKTERDVICEHNSHDSNQPQRVEALPPLPPFRHTTSPRAKHGSFSSYFLTVEASYTHTHAHALTGFGGEGARVEEQLATHLLRVDQREFGEAHVEADAHAHADHLRLGLVRERDLETEQLLAGREDAGLLESELACAGGWLAGGGWNPWQSWLQCYYFQGDQYTVRLTIVTAFQPFVKVCVCVLNRGSHTDRKVKGGWGHFEMLPAYLAEGSEAVQSGLTSQTHCPHSLDLVQPG